MLKINYTKREIFILAGILLLGLLLRVLYLNEIIKNPGFSSPILDASFHKYWAKGLAVGNWSIPESYNNPQISSIPYQKSPGYLYFLAFIYRLFGLNHLAVVAAQMVLGTVSSCLAFILGRKFFGSAVGLIFSASMSFYWIFIYFEGELYAPVLLVFLSLLLIYTLSKWIEKTSFWLCTAGGIVLGLFALVRSNILIFTPAVIVWLFWILYRKKNLQSFALSALGFVFAIVLTISPVTIRNYVIANELVLISTNGGLNLFIANNEISDDITPIIPDLKNMTGLDSWTPFDYSVIVRGLEKKVGKLFKFSEASTYWINEAIRYIKTHPGKTLERTFRKAALFWHPMEIANPTQIFYDRFHSIILRNIPGDFSAAFALSIVGIVLLFLNFKKQSFLFPLCKEEAGGFGNREISLKTQKSQYEVTVLILLFIFTYFVSFLPFLVSARFRVPIIPFLLLFGSYGIYHVAGFIGSRNFTSAAVGLTAIIIIYLMLNKNFVNYEPDHALWYFHRGQSLLQKGKTDRAIKEYLEAVRIKPAYPEAYNYMGVALSKKGKHTKAIKQYRKTLLIKPDYNAALNNLGVALASEKKYDEAITYYRKALSVYPDFAEVHYNLGFALSRKNMMEEAVKHFSRTLLIKPDYADAHFELGFILANQEKYEEAYAHYSRALSIKPNDVRIHFNLGVILVKQEKFEKAITSFSEALRIKPDYVEADHNIDVSTKALQQQKQRR